MSCKLGDKCDNVFACNILRPNVELLGCNFYKPKKPMTNEEWMKSVSVSEAIGYFCYKALGSDGCNACRLNTKEKCRLNEWLKEIHKE